MDAKALRTANKEKAHRLAGGGDSYPGSQDKDTKAPDALDADVKTGARPISKPKFKRGGVVPGANAKHHAGRPARKEGGGCGESYVNRDVKEANEDRDGKKHVGGWQKGGRAEKAAGGKIKKPDIDYRSSSMGKLKDSSLPKGWRDKKGLEVGPAFEDDSGYKKGGAAKRPGKLYGGGLYGMETKPTGANGVAAMVETKKGNKANGGATKKKASGGIVMNDQDIRKPGVTGVMPPLGKGAARGTEVVDETTSVKAKAPMFAKSNYGGIPSGNSIATKDASKIMGLGKNFEGMMPSYTPEQVKAAESPKKGTAPVSAKAPAAAVRAGRQDGGRVAKGKTNINIIIAPQGGKAADAPVPPDMPPPPPPMIKPPMPAAAPPGPPAGLAAALGAGPPHAGGGMPPPMPMMRRDGGKVPHMDYGAGGGKGRLEKIKEYGANAKA